MTEHKEDLVVIFAGYKEEMQKFIDVNPGMKSRITNRIQFDDYSTEELFEIFSKNAEKSKLKIASGVKDVLLSIFAEKSKNKDFGNARFVENLFQQAIIKHSRNIMKKLRNKEISDNDACIETLDLESIKCINI